MINFPRLYIGPVSINTINATIEVANEKNIKLGLIPSRRQVDYCGGYIGLNTKSFAEYVHSKSELITLERDHGGKLQGQEEDDGTTSFISDLGFMDIIHIDPFKATQDIMKAAELTVIHIKYLNALNKDTQFEIGTEEGIRKYNSDEYSRFLDYIWKNTTQEIQDRILYLVIQGGTRVRSGKNIGDTNFKSLRKFIKICNSFNKNSKEHNGDYMTMDEINQRFELGLSAINIAPEFGSIESTTYLNLFNDHEKAEFFNLVLKSNKWIKWFDKSFNPLENKQILIKMCGHYIFETKEFKEIKNNYDDADLKAVANIKAKILEITNG